MLSALSWIDIVLFDLKDNVTVSITLPPRDTHRKGLSTQHRASLCAGRSADSNLDNSHAELE